LARFSLWLPQQKFEKRKKNLGDKFIQPVIFIFIFGDFLNFPAKFSM
jgi:hypothetical protein